MQLLRTLRHVLTVHSWWHLPRFAYGSSRGGAMTLILALRFPLQVRSYTSHAVHFSCLSSSTYASVSMRTKSSVIKKESIWKASWGSM